MTRAPANDALRPPRCPPRCPPLRPSAWRRWLALAGVGTLAATAALVPVPALAAPGDAAATGLTLDLGASVLGEPVISASGSAGAVDAPPSDTLTGAAIGISGLGVATSGTVVESTAVSAPGGTSALASVTDVTVDVLGLTVFSADALQAEVACPTGETPTAEADVVTAGASVLGADVTALAPGSTATVSAAVTVPGLTDATLTATVRRSEAVTARTASAAAYVIDLVLAGETLSGPFVDAVGRIAVARVSCQALAPSVESLDPAEGPTSGGTTVTIQGAEFVAGGTTVTFGDSAPVAATVSADGTSLTVVTPPSEVAGAVDVTVTTTGGSATLADAYTYVAPEITDITPAAGPLGGGTEVTITGTGLGTASSVTFGGRAGTGLVVSTDGTTLTVTTPAGAALGAVDVVVELEGADATAEDGYTYALPPSASSLSPDRGPTGGGTTVTIQGEGFAAGATTVRFGDSAAVAAEVSADGTSLTVVTPPSETAGTVDVTVTTPLGSDTLADAYTYLAPEITDITPAAGPLAGGNEVIIDGAGLGSASSVTFGGVAGTGLTVAPDGTSLTVTAPAGAALGAVDVVVVLDGADATAPAGYTYAAAPEIASLSPDEGPTGGDTLVTIMGEGFVAGETTVTFGDAGTVAADVSGDGTSLTVTTPASETAGAVDVTVTTPAGSDTLADGFTYVAPEITDITPAEGPLAGGTEVTIEGTGLGTASRVTFGGRAGTDLSVSADGTSLTVTVPAGAELGAVDVVVELAGADATAEDAYTYAELAALAVIGEVSPEGGPATGGTPVTIRGSGLGGVTEVWFGDRRGTGLEVSEDGTELTVISPLGALGTEDITLVFEDGSELVLEDAFEYAAADADGDGSDGSLPQTGRGIWGSLLAGLSLLLGGGALTRVSRRFAIG